MQNEQASEKEPIIKLKKKCWEKESVFVVDWLAEHTGMSKVKIKKVIELGGLWIKKSNTKKIQRTKKIKTELNNGDYIEFNYDPKIVPMDISNAVEVYKGKGFGVWYKPAGMLSDGSPFSDKGSISFAVKQSGKQCFLIQRLDREVSGLMIVAYDKQRARYFSTELQEKRIDKYYLAECLTQLGEDGEIDTELDGKKSLTLYKIVEKLKKTTKIEIELKTGRFHQIRRHMTMIAAPLIGDPKYGRGNKNSEGLQLQAYKVSFFIPKKDGKLTVEVPQDKRLF